MQHEIRHWVWSTLYTCADIKDTHANGDALNALGRPKTKLLAVHRNNQGERGNTSVDMVRESRTPVKIFVMHRARTKA
jgi:hypothetical protein